MKPDISSIPDGAHESDRSSASASRYRWYALLLMAAAYACHSVDRMVLSVVLEPIKNEFQMSDRAMGLLGGLAYAASFALACLPIGWLIDHVSRRKLLAALLTVWSGLTLLCGFATSYGMLLLMRMGVGLAEAGGQPTCISLISDFFRPRERSSAIGYFYLSIAVGIAASFLMGGVVAATWGWRAAFFVAGVPGLLTGIMILTTLREPTRGQFEGEETAPSSMADAVRFVFRTPALLHVIAAITLASMASNGMWLWVTSLLIRVHEMPIASAGVVVAFAAGFSAIGSAVAGRIADWRARRSLAAQLQVAIFTSLLCAPFGTMLALTSSLPVAIFCLMVGGFATGAYLGPSYSMAMTLSPVGMRGMVAAIVQLAINLIGTGLGPIITGTISDAFGGGSKGLSYALAITMLVSLWAAFHYYFAYRHARCHFEVMESIPPAVGVTAVY